MIRHSLALVVLSLALLSTAAHAQDDGCISSKCHATVGKAAWVHGPVGVGACTVCHNRVEGKEHEFIFSVEKEELCFACHDEKRDMMAEAHLHTPVANGDCVGCHDPHQSEHRFQLKGETSTMCFNCHDKSLFEGQHVHGPVNVGDCNACHNPHASAFPQQLRSAPEALCFECHEDRKDILQQSHAHPPVEEACTECHQPHASQARFLLTQEAPGLCFGCHEDLKDYAAVTNPHSPVQSGRCVECHNVHGSNYPRLMPKPMTELCYGCHEEFGEYVDAQDFRHGPVEDDDCVACHDPHGSDFHRLLRKYFPEDFYVAYAEENYDMCFECHNRQIAVEEETATLTDFRDGKRNLHFVHVNKIEKGRSCRACHHAHASSQMKHIRKSVPYGKMNWDLPVTFTKTDDGGSCEVGCHNPKEYSRK